MGAAVYMRHLRIVCHCASDKTSSTRGKSFLPSFPKKKIDGGRKERKERKREYGWNEEIKGEEY